MTAPPGGGGEWVDVTCPKSRIPFLEDPRPSPRTVSRPAMFSTFTNTPAYQNKRAWGGTYQMKIACDSEWKSHQQQGVHDDRRQPARVR
jgi:hypothetical protein